MRALLSVRARRAAGAADRSRGVLRGDRQRRRASVAACDRIRSSATVSSSIATIRNGDHDRLGRPRRVLSAQDHDAGRAGARHRALDRAISRPMSPARPAPPTTRTTPGSSASPTTSRSRSGSATTMPTASAARSAAARPAATWRSRSSSRSSRRCGPMWRRRPRSRRHRPRPSASWRASRSISSPAKCRSAGGKADHRVLPDRSQRPDHRHAVSTGLARGCLLRRANPAAITA